MKEEQIKKINQEFEDFYNFLSDKGNNRGYYFALGARSMMWAFHNGGVIDVKTKTALTEKLDSKLKENLGS